MAVVAHHAFPGQVPIGAAGVDLFFVVSGFIMMSCAGKRTPFAFLADRAWRIYPLWLIAVTPWLLMEPHTPLEVLRSLTLWPVFSGQWLNPALGVGWTLSFEIVFYLAFALALRTRATVPLFLFGLCLILGMSTKSILFWFLGSPLSFEFLLGVAIARLPYSEKGGLCAVGAAIVGFLLAPTGFYDQAFDAGAAFRVLAWGIPAALLLYGARSLERYFDAKAFAPAVLVGSASYSIYLFHQLVMLETHGWAGLAGSALAGIVAFWFVEQPIMKARPAWAKPEPGPVERSWAAQSGESASLRT